MRFGTVNARSTSSSAGPTCPNHPCRSNCGYSWTRALSAFASRDDSTCIRFRVGRYERRPSGYRTTSASGRVG